MKLTVRNVLGYLLSNVFLFSGMVSIKRNKLLQSSCIIPLYFHNPSKSFFLSCIQWLKKNGFSFISTNELLAISKGELDFPMGAVLITLDDGWRNNKENVVPIANEFKVPITIFASTAPIEKGDAYWWSYIKVANSKNIMNTTVPALKRINNEERNVIIAHVRNRLSLSPEALSVDDLKEINTSSYVTFGSHTVNHPILTMCTSKESLYEITESKKKLQVILENTNVDCFSYPNGDFSDREIIHLKNAGYKLAFTTKPSLITNNNISNRYSLPRYGMLEDASFTENICRMTGIWFDNYLLYKNK
jgi:peptidoglycan/xylan/chitin deacetylase (PgdA/CDA1 family)